MTTLVVLSMRLVNCYNSRMNSSNTRDALVLMVAIPGDAKAKACRFASISPSPSAPDRLPISIACLAG